MFFGIYNAQEIIYSENFNNSATLGHWQMLDRDRDGFTWAVMNGNTLTANGGWDNASGQMMRVFSYKETGEVGPLDSDDVLVSPVIDIPNSGNIELSYKIGVATDNFMGKKMNDMSYQLFVIEEGSSFFPTLVPLDEKQFSNARSAEKRSINLNAYKGKSVRLYWRHYKAFGQYLLLLDDIQIRKTTSKSVITNEQRVYPNPVENTLYIGGFEEIKSYSLYNAAGRLLKVGGNEKEIYVGNLVTGSYIVVVEGISEKKSFKFIKK